MLPSVLGVHVFHHHCNGCEENETIARMLTTIHSHDHDCPACTCQVASQSSQEGVSHDIQHHDSDCKHDFKKAAFEGQRADLKYKWQAEVIALNHFSWLPTDLLRGQFTPQKNFCYVILKIPDETSPEMNCVFLL